MKCEICREQEATTYISYVLGGKEYKIHVCEYCVETNKIVADSLQSLGVDNLVQELGSVIDSMLLNYDTPSAKAKKCSRCGFTLEDIRKTGKLGCPYDYDLFSEELSAGLKRIHKSTKHIGKCPSRLNLVEQLKFLQEELDSAIEIEDYEKAAVLRDKIKDLQNKENKS